eukprot:1884382-Ditylum_brightwellii.AAC.1
MHHYHPIGQIQKYGLSVPNLRKMKCPSEAIGTISMSQSSLLLSIINVWAHATPMARRNLLSQQHL